MLGRKTKNYLLTRIHKLARSAALRRLRGDITGALRLETRLENEMQHAKMHGHGQAAYGAEARGRSAGEMLHRKSSLRHRRGYSVHRRSPR